MEFLTNIYRAEEKQLEQGLLKVEFEVSLEKANAEIDFNVKKKRNEDKAEKLKALSEQCNKLTQTYDSYNDERMTALAYVITASRVT